jgi:hypothetical protein
MIDEESVDAIISTVLDHGRLTKAVLETWGIAEEDYSELQSES